MIGIHSWCGSCVISILLVFYLTQWCVCELLRFFPYSYPAIQLFYSIPYIHDMNGHGWVEINLYIFDSLKLFLLVLLTVLVSFFMLMHNRGGLECLLYLPFGLWLLQFLFDLWVMRDSGGYFFLHFHFFIFNLYESQFSV